MSLFDPQVQARLEAERAKRTADHILVVTLGSGLSFAEALAKGKADFKAKRLHLKGWQQHPTDPRFYFRATPDGGAESKLETVLAVQWPSVDLCESPIEVAYYEAIVGLGLFGYSIQLQYDVTCIDAYRLDFAFITTHPRLRKVCVEVDGHDHHERTKEQAQRDRQRDRRLTHAGWNVLRFTGSEVYRNAAACAQETIEHLGAASLG